MIKDIITKYCLGARGMVENDQRRNHKILFRCTGGWLKMIKDIITRYCLGARGDAHCFLPVQAKSSKPFCRVDLR